MFCNKILESGSFGEFSVTIGYHRIFWGVDSEDPYFAQKKAPYISSLHKFKVIFTIFLHHVDKSWLERVFYVDSKNIRNIIIIFFKILK